MCYYLNVQFQGQRANFSFSFSKHVLIPVILLQNLMFQFKYCLELMLNERVVL